MCKSAVANGTGKCGNACNRCVFFNRAAEGNVSPIEAAQPKHDDTLDTPIINFEVGDHEPAPADP
jgi:hypothetical protein